MNLHNFIDNECRIWKTYCIEYIYEGKRYQIDMYAQSRQDAENRLSAIKRLGFIDGELCSTLDIKQSLN